MVTVLCARGASCFCRGEERLRCAHRTPDRACKPGALTAERQRTHGEWSNTARLCGALKRALHDVGGRGIALMGDDQVEALDMILAKIARIVSGDPQHPDHWDDIAGYALLGKGGDRP